MIPKLIEEVMSAGAAIAISISAGKDSQAMLHYVVGLYKQHHWTGKLFAIFADLGSIEWQGTLEHAYRMCRDAGINLVVVQRSSEGMIGRWQERREAMLLKEQDSPFWSSASSRYCTDHLKVQQIDKLLRSIQPIDELEKVGDAPFWSSATSRYCTKELKENQCDKELRTCSDLVVCCVGIRAQESVARAGKPLYTVRNGITTASLKKPKEVTTATDHQAWAESAWDSWQKFPIDPKTGVKPRLSITWHPIFEWSLEEVWQECGTSIEDLTWRRELFQIGMFDLAFHGWQGHWAYVSGNSRLSCSQCVLASRGDLENGAKLNQGTWRELVTMEQESGWSFKNKFALGELASTIEGLPLGWVDAVYASLRELGLIYLDRHWRLNGQELTDLLARSLAPDDLAKAFQLEVSIL